MKHTKNNKPTTPENPSQGAKYRASPEGKLNIIRHVFYIGTWMTAPVLYYLAYQGKLYERERMPIAVGILICGVVFTFLADRYLKQLLEQQADGQRRFMKTGLYKIMRHPFYFGQTIIMVGMVTLFPSFLVLIFFIGYIVATHSTMSKEEQNMIGEFGEEYISYKEHTPIYPWVIWKYWKRWCIAAQLYIGCVDRSR